MGLKLKKILVKEMQKSRWLKHNKTLCYAHVKPSSDVPGMVTLLRTSLAKKYIYIQAVPVLWSRDPVGSGSPWLNRT